jgi:undecaprenyl diphosphate synthase
MNPSSDKHKPSHVAIIMDGNGRWAAARGWPRTAGHRAGADSVRRVVEAAPGLGIRTLTLYAFSSDNWKRPASEINTLMNMFQSYLQKETPRCVEHGIRVSVIGRRDRLPLALCAAIDAAENATAGGENLHVRVAVDYSSREAILDAVRRARSLACVTREEFTQLLVGDVKSSPQIAEVDLLIRTGGEQRLSDFLLWECAYAELYFTPVLWPDFTAADLEEAVAEYYRRERRFGGLPAECVAS